ncbi:hypothetical protein GCM10009828_071980 [Actinoplanes couchii]|uniref:Uncharacterized protein n=1 Tax=Actinoplanes couchii TaxID=403638 RepID=A0ABQ3X0P4_9ACTN|nr:hypothetical protein Aco03nite_004940 [Actinoplanes couchii]
MVSCRHTTSGAVPASQSSSRGSRARTELTFQVAKRIQTFYRVAAARAVSSPAIRITRSVTSKVMIPPITVESACE